MATNVSIFNSISSTPDFPKMEREILSHWYRRGIVKKYLTKNSKNKKRFSFLDGPITANNPMGVHHAWGRTYKDLFQRYKNMQGYWERFQSGFDEQGLWVEVEVEKELGLKSKRDIENLVKGDEFRSIAKFVDLCRARVKKYSQIQTEQSRRLGYFMDWEASYHTSSPENNYMIWHFLKKCFLQGLIYKGLDSVPWCPRCATAISQHEMLTEDYQELTHKSVYLRYPIVGRTDEFLLVWTTTPWTLPGNVAIAVNPLLTYSKVRIPGERAVYYIGKDRIIPVFGHGVEVLEELPGDRLVSLSYTGPFDDLTRVDEAQRENPRTFHRTIGAKELVTGDEGTGLVHIAPGAGHEDFQLGRENRLSVIHLIDEFANFLPGLGKISGGKTSDPKKILEITRDKGFLVREENYTHRYPVCWRCKSDLVFRAVPEWYIAMDPLREGLTNVAKRIDWIPTWGLEREIDWLRNMDDWLISKKRYWGLALPIWECKECHWFTVVGGRDELRGKAIEGWDKFSGHSPHRPYLDEVKIRCEGCGGVSSRIPDVGNPWLDAGIVPFSTLLDKKKISYTNDKKYWQEWFPADFITESFPGQFKNWFYSLLTMSTVLENSEPFKTVLGFASLTDERGEIMHKSKGNMIEFNEAADKIGADVMRWLYSKQDPARNLLFGYKVAYETRRAFHLPLWNIYNFFLTYANFDGWKPRKVSGIRYQGYQVSGNVLDKWIIARLKQVVSVTTNFLENYDAMTGSRAIEEFVTDLSTWYIRRSRDRVGPTAINEQDKKNFYQTCFFVLVTLAKILAPFVPFLSEAIYKNLTTRLSVHLEDWPELPEIEKREEVTVEAMGWIRRGAEAGHAARKNSGIKVRQPLGRALVSAPVKSPTKPFLDVLADELNVREVKWTKKRVETCVVEIRTKLSSELVLEGKARDLVREIQDLRKKKNLGLGDRVKIKSPWLPENKKLLDWIKSKTLAETLELGQKLEIKKTQ